MDDNTNPPTRAEIVRRMNERCGFVEALVVGHSEAQLTELRDAAGWSVKDHLAHLAPWAFGMADLLIKRPRWFAMGLTLEQWDANFETDAMTELLYEADKNRSLADVMTLFRSANTRLAWAVETLESDANLLMPYRRFQPFEQPPNDSADPIWPRLVGNSFGHIDEHLEWIAEWLPGS